MRWIRPLTQVALPTALAVLGITAAVKAGTYTISDLAPGASSKLRVKALLRVKAAP